MAKTEYQKDCGRCSAYFEALKNPKAHPECFYQKVELVIDYDSFDYIEKVCSECEDDDSSWDDSHECEPPELGKPTRHRKVFPCSKLLEGVNIKENNTISRHNYFLKKLKGVKGVFKGDVIEYVKIKLRAKKPKLKLE